MMRKVSSPITKSLLWRPEPQISSLRSRVNSSLSIQLSHSCAFIGSRKPSEWISRPAILSIAFDSLSLSRIDPEVCPSSSYLWGKSKF